MKKNKPNEKKMNEAQLLDLLKQVLPKATRDPKLAGKIYDAVEKELELKARQKAFETFCKKCELPDLESSTVKDVRRQLNDAFRASELTLKPNRRAKTLAVEVALRDGALYSGEIKVKPVAEGDDGEQEFKPKFVPFPVALPGDKDLVWLLAKRENLSPQEAGINLSKAEEEFWMSKSGQKLIRERVERAFPEFIARVPAGMLAEAGLKRHYKDPEPVKVLRPSLKS